MSEIERLMSQGVVFGPAVVCYFMKGDKVLLGLRKKVSLGLGKDLYAGIGGKVGDSEELKNETPEEALIRETFEEIKAKILKFKKMGRVRFIQPTKPQWQYDVVVYVVDEWEGEPQETTVIKPVWFDTSNLPISQMWDDNLYFVPKVLSGEEVNAIFLLDENSKVTEYIFE